MASEDSPQEPKEVPAPHFLVPGVRTGLEMALVGVIVAMIGLPATDPISYGIVMLTGLIAMVIVLFWALVPPVSGGLAYVTATMLRRDDIPETVGVPLLAAIVGGILANIQMGIIPSAPGESQGSVAGVIARAVEAPAISGIDAGAVGATLLMAALSFLFIRQRTRESVEGGIRTFLLVLGSVVAFSSGGSQVGLATGPLENLYRAELGLPGIVLLGVGASGILAGAWMGAPRLLQATSREYAQLGVRRSIAALVPGFVIAQTAIALGIPISFNNIMISAIIGGGLAAGSAGVSRRKIGVTLAFWLVTLVTSVGVGFGLYRLFAAVLGA